MKFGSGMYSVMILALIIAGVLTLVSNPYKASYKKEQPVSYQEAKNSFKTGYPAGEDIPVAKCIEDIRSNQYCTIEVSKENIESLRFFLIKDISESGNKSSKEGRTYTFSYIPKCYKMKFDLIGDMKYATRQISWNFDNTSYGEWCAVTLESGERILVLVDLQLLDIPQNQKIKLPIGEVIDDRMIEGLTDEYAAYNLEKENASWYVDMVGNWEEEEVGDINVTGRFFIVFLIAVPLIIYAMYKYAVREGLVEKI